MTSGEPLASRYDALLLDLDGVVYRGDQAVPSAPETLERARDLGVPVLFLTNNSARTPDEVAERLRRLGVHAKPEEILTSALATASLLRREGAGGSRAFVVGETGIRDALTAAGIELLEGEPDQVDLVVVGWDRSADYAKLKRACLLVERGARLVATNPDASYPAADGLWPGAGALLSVITTTTGAAPTIVGKPARPMFEVAAQATGATNPLVVGDRLDTDILGADSMRWDSLLVLTGASTLPELVDAEHLPTYVAPDVSGLLDANPPARFRQARPEEASAIRALLEASGLRAEGVESRIADTLVSAERQETGEIDATACVAVVGPFGILRSLAVRKALQGKYLGMLAVAAAAAQARAKGLQEIYLFTETSEPFFERLGFRRIERGTLPEPVRISPQATEECAETAVVMVRALSGSGPRLS